MRCVICGSRFYFVSFSAPAEPCDCGAEVTAECERDARPERRQEIADMRAGWQAGTWPLPPASEQEEGEES